MVVVESEAEIAVAAHEIVVGPVLPPGPPPGPGPQPPIDGKADAVLVVFDDASTTPDEQEVIAHLREHFDDAGIIFKSWSDETPGVDGKPVADPAIDWMRGKGFEPPFVIVYGEKKPSGKRPAIWFATLPATAKEVIDHAE
jgi:hypothetical protein